MLRKGAMRWFGPFLLATTVAVAAEIGLSAFEQATMMPPVPQPEPRIESPEEKTQAAPTFVTIEPSRIEVVARRAAVQVEVRANPPSGRRRPG